MCFFTFKTAGCFVRSCCSCLLINRTKHTGHEWLFKVDDTEAYKIKKLGKLSPRLDEEQSKWTQELFFDTTSVYDDFWTRAPARAHDFLEKWTLEKASWTTHLPQVTQLKLKGTT